MTRERLEQMTAAELRAYARQHFSTISRITNRKQLLAAIERMAEREGGYRG